MLLFPSGIQGAVRWLLGLFGISASRTWRTDDDPDALSRTSPEGSSSGT